MSDEAVKYPGQHDFLLGRGGETNNHSGNILFRQLIKEYKEAYQNAPKTQKPLISQKLVARWRSMSPPGRFLERAEPDKNWKDVGDAVACRKTSKALGERGKRSRSGNGAGSDSEEPSMVPSTVVATGTKRKAEGAAHMHGVGLSTPPAARAKLAPNSMASPLAAASMASPVAAANKCLPADLSALAAAAAAGANNTNAPTSAVGSNAGLSSLLQSLGYSSAAPQQAAAAAAPNAGLMALLEQHQKQQQPQQHQSGGIAALLELQRLQQQQQPQSATPDLSAALLAMTQSGNSNSTDLASLLEQHQTGNNQKKPLDLSALLGQATSGSAAAPTQGFDLAALLAGQQKKPDDFAALLGQSAAANNSDLATLLEKQKRQSDLSALLEQQQKNQQTQSSLAALLGQHQRNPDLAALLDEQQKKLQQSQSSIASLMENQQQKGDILALLEQSRNQQLQSSLAAFLEQKNQNQQQQPDFSALLGQQQNQQTSQSAALAALLSEEQRSQQLQASLVAALDQQKGGSGTPSEAAMLAAFMEQRKQPAVSSAQENGAPATDAKPAATNNNFSEILAALGRQHGPAAASPGTTGIDPSSAARIQSLLSGAHLQTGASLSKSALESLFVSANAGMASKQASQGKGIEAPGRASNPSMMESHQNETRQETSTTNSASLDQQRRESIFQLLSMQNQGTHQHSGSSYSATDSNGVTAAMAAALGRMDSSLVQQYQNNASQGTGQRKY